MKQTIRLTESELRNLISESVVKILNEGMYGFPDDCDQQRLFRIITAVIAAASG